MKNKIESWTIDSWMPLEDVLALYAARRRRVTALISVLEAAVDLMQDLTSFRNVENVIPLGIVSELETFSEDIQRLNKVLKTWDGQPTVSSRTRKSKRGD